MRLRKLFFELYKMKKILLAIAVALSAMALAADEQEYLRYVEEADKAVQKQEWNRAEELLRAAMQLEPSNPQNVMLLSNVGMFQYYRGEDSLALHTLSEARAIAPASTVVLVNRAKVLTGMGRTDDAIRDYDRVIEMDSANYRAYFERAYLRMNRNDSVGAAADLKMLVKLRPDDPNTLLILAVSSSNAGRYEEAVSYYNRLIAKEKRAEYFGGRAMARLAKGDLAEASDDIGQGLDLDPEDGELYFCRAYMHLLQYDEAAAKADAALAAKFGVDPRRIADLFSLK